MTEKNADEVLRNTFEELDLVLEERHSDNSGDGTSKTEEKTGRCREKTMHDRKRAERVPNEK